MCSAGGGGGGGGGRRRRRRRKHVCGGWEGDRDLEGRPTGRAACPRVAGCRPARISCPPRVSPLAVASLPRTGERANDDFFLHYGFVPPRNPHDQVALFTGVPARAGSRRGLSCLFLPLSRGMPPLPCLPRLLYWLGHLVLEAVRRQRCLLPPHTRPSFRPIPLPTASDIESTIDWWLDRHLPPGALPPQRLQAAINAAYSAAEDEDGAAMAAAQVLAAVPAEEAEVIRAELDTIKLSGERRREGWGKCKWTASDAQHSGCCATGHVRRCCWRRYRCCWRRYRRATARHSVPRRGAPASPLHFASLSQACQQPVTTLYCPPPNPS